VFFLDENDLGQVEFIRTQFDPKIKRYSKSLEKRNRSNHFDRFENAQ